MGRITTLYRCGHRWVLEGAEKSEKLRKDEVCPLCRLAAEHRKKRDAEREQRIINSQEGRLEPPEQGRWKDHPRRTAFRRSLSAHLPKGYRWAGS